MIFALGLRKVLLQRANDRLLDEALVVVRVNQNADKTSRQKYGSPKILNRASGPDNTYMSL